MATDLKGSACRSTLTPHHPARVSGHLRPRAPTPTISSSSTCKAGVAAAQAVKASAPLRTPDVLGRRRLTLALIAFRAGVWLCGARGAEPDVTWQRACSVAARACRPAAADVAAGAAGLHVPQRPRRPQARRSRAPRRRPVVSAIDPPAEVQLRSLVMNVSARKIVTTGDPSFQCCSCPLGSPTPRPGASGPRGGGARPSGPAACSNLVLAPVGRLLGLPSTASLILSGISGTCRILLSLSHSCDVFALRSCTRMSPRGRTAGRAPSGRGDTADSATNAAASRSPC